MGSIAVFKICPNCSEHWQTRQDFLTNSTVELNGYQPSFKNLESGFLLFTHNIDGCESTMGVRVKEFLDFYKGERYTENKAFTPECPRYCLNEKNLDRCDVICECAFVRDIIQAILAVKNRV